MKNSYSVTVVRTLFFCLSTICASLPALAQVASPSPTERAFIGNAGPGVDIGYDEGAEDQDFSDRAYNEFFTSVQQWGHYEIVADPARADWIFETSVSNNRTCVEPDYSLHKSSQKVTQDNYRITVLMTDARDKNVRERFSEAIGTPGYFTSFDKLFDQTIVNLIDDLKKAEGKPNPGKTPLFPHNSPPAPLPPRISLAQKVYIHSRSDPRNSSDRYSGGGAQVYDQFAALLKTWGRYQIVPQAEADLILDLSFSSPEQCNGYGDPQLQLYIIDPKTDTYLWAFATHIGSAVLDSNAHKNFAQGIAELGSDMRYIAGHPTWALDASLHAKPEFVPVLASAAHPSVHGAVPLISVSLPTNVVKAGSSISATVTVQNNTRQNFSFNYPEGDPLTCVIAVRDADGNAARETAAGLNLEHAHAIWKGVNVSYFLRPGEKQIRQCPVSTLFDMSSPGKYSIAVKELDGSPAASNLVTVTVQP